MSETEVHLHLTVIGTPTLQEVQKWVDKFITRVADDRILDYRVSSINHDKNAPSR